MRICIAAASAVSGMVASTLLVLGFMKFLVLPDVALVFLIGAGYMLTATLAMVLGHLYEKALPCKR